MHQNNTNGRTHSPFKKVNGSQYQADQTFSEDDVIAEARSIALKRILSRTEAASSPSDMARHLQDFHLGCEREQFAVTLLDTRHHILHHEVLFVGTLNGATVHPREVVKLVLKWNAGAVCFSHNHPSGISEPSQADINLTKRLQEALEFVDVRVLDHLVVSDKEWVSMSDRGLI